MQISDLYRVEIHAANMKKIKELDGRKRTQGNDLFVFFFFNIM